MAGLIYIVCEGQSESQFVKTIYIPGFLKRQATVVNWFHIL